MRVREAVSGVLGVVACVLGASGASVEATFATPTLDRWNYAFASASSPRAAVFSPIGSSFQDQFDDRDGQFLVGFTTSIFVPSGLPTSNYRIRSARLVARVNYDQAFRYDPTPDPRTSYRPDQPGYAPDADPGRALELFGVGYRNGWTAATFQQTTAYRPSGGFAPSLRDRNAFAADYDVNGLVRDISNNIKDGIDVTPWAVGVAQTNPFQPNAVAPGALVPANTDFAFDLDVANPSVIRYVREGLALGRLNLMVTSLGLTSQQTTNDTPAFYLRAFTIANDDPGYVPASLQLSVCVGPPGDWNCSGAKDLLDIFAFLGDWFAGNADFNSNGQTELLDIFSFLEAWFAA